MRIIVLFAFNYRIKILFAAIFSTLFFCGVVYGFDVEQKNISIVVCGDRDAGDCKFRGTNGVFEAASFARDLRLKMGCDSNIDIIINNGLYVFEETLKLDSIYDGGCNNSYTSYVANGNNVVFSGKKSYPVKKYESNIYYSKNKDLLNKLSFYYAGKSIDRYSLSDFFVKKWISMERACNKRLCNGILTNLHSDLYDIANISGVVYVNKEFQTDILRIKKSYDYNGFIFIEINDYDWGKMEEQKFPRSMDGEKGTIFPKNITNKEKNGWVNNNNSIIFNGFNISNGFVDVGNIGTIISIGDGGYGVKNLRIVGIGFQNTSFDAPGNGYVPRQAMVGGWSNGKFSRIYGAIRVNNLSNFYLINCKFKNLGGFGVVNEIGLRNFNAINNSFEDIGAGAIYISTNVTISNESAGGGIYIIGNKILNHSLEYSSAAAIFSGYASDILLYKNHIKNSPYSAISVGWGWSNKETNLKNTKIIGNLIENSMLKLSDGGAIYLLSKQNNSVVEGNKIFGFKLSNSAVFRFAAAVYLDAGVSGVYIGCNHFYDFNSPVDAKVFRYFNQSGNSGNNFQYPNDLNNECHSDYFVDVPSRF